MLHGEAQGLQRGCRYDLGFLSFSCSCSNQVGYVCTHTCVHALRAHGCTHEHERVYMYMCVQYDCGPLVLCALPVSVLAYESRHASECTYVHTTALFCLVHVHTHAIASVRKFTILGTLWKFPLSPWDTMDLFTDMPSLVSTKVCWGPGRAEQSPGPVLALGI